MLIGNRLCKKTAMQNRVSHLLDRVGRPQSVMPACLPAPGRVALETVGQWPARGCSQFSQASPDQFEFVLRSAGSRCGPRLDDGDTPP